MSGGNGHDPVTPGTIAVLHQGWVLSELDDWLGTMRELYPGRLEVRKARGNQIARQRNLCIAGDWVLFVDADVVPPLGALPQLLGHGLPLVGGVYLERLRPQDGRVCATTLDDPPAQWRLADLPRAGVIPVGTVGTGCLLIRRAVFEAVEPPWFRCGQLVPDLLMEDADFCLRAAAAGFPPHLDCAVRAGHAVSGVLWPGRDGQRWVEWAGDVREPAEAAEAGT